MLICRNDEGVHGQRKVGNPCSVKKSYEPLEGNILIRSEASHMFFKIKQQLFANEPKGGPQQAVWGTFLEVCLRSRNSNIHPCL